MTKRSNNPKGCPPTYDWEYWAPLLWDLKKGEALYSDRAAAKIVGCSAMQVGHIRKRYGVAKWRGDGPHTGEVFGVLARKCAVCNDIHPLERHHFTLEPIWDKKGYARVCRQCFEAGERREKKGWH